MHSTPRPTQHRQLLEALASLPHVSESREGLLGQEAALAAFFRIKRMGSGASDRTTAHVPSLVAEALADLEPVPDEHGTFVITAEELQGVVAGAAIRGAMQLAADIAATRRDVEDLLAIVQDPFATSGESGGEARQPAA